MSLTEIQQMPRQDKLRLLEALWTDLTRDEAAMESPAWHATVLAETEQRLADGKEQILDWDQVKTRLREIEEEQ
jgi:hypothetical protein